MTADRLAEIRERAKWDDNGYGDTAWLLDRLAAKDERIVNLERQRAAQRDRLAAAERVLREFAEWNSGYNTSSDWTNVIARRAKEYFEKAYSAVSGNDNSGGDLAKAYDPDYMCPNCVTPWKCNGPHTAQRSTTDPNSVAPEKSEIVSDIAVSRKNRDGSENLNSAKQTEGK